MIKSRKAFSGADSKLADPGEKIRISHFVKSNEIGKTRPIKGGNLGKKGIELEVERNKCWKKCKKGKKQGGGYQNHVKKTERRDALWIKRSRGFQRKEDAGHHTGKPRKS